MERDGDNISVSEKEASNKTRPQGVRWVLAVSLLLALLAMSMVWIVPALS